LIQFAQTQFLSCDTQTTIQEAARRMVKASADSIVVLDSEERPLGVATMNIIS
jgi:signal-transduction protein with cAMP-binding, CBS, and nucleotidyltransferase domain